MLALVEMLGRCPPTDVTLLVVQLLCAPLDMKAAGFAGRWKAWMLQHGLGCVRLALTRVPADDTLLNTIVMAVLCCTSDEVESCPCPQMRIPQLFPALLEACARAPVHVQARQLERCSLWLRVCPSNCHMLTELAPQWQPHAASILAAGVGYAIPSQDAKGEQPTGLQSSMPNALGSTYLVELLCTYVIESLTLELGPAVSDAAKATTARVGEGLWTNGATPSKAYETATMPSSDGAWPALDIVCVVTQGCGNDTHVRAARWMLLHRVLSSLVRLGARLGQTAPSLIAPKLFKLCEVVRTHIFAPLSPTTPVDTSVTVRSTGAHGQPFVELRLQVHRQASTLQAAQEIGWQAMQAARGPVPTGRDVQLLVQLFEAFDALIVRAMMDDSVDAALRMRLASNGQPKRDVTSATLGRKLLDATGGQSAAESLQGIADSLLTFQQGLTERFRTRGRALSNADDAMAGQEVIADAAAAGPAASCERSTGGSAHHTQMPSPLAPPQSTFGILLDLLIFLGGASEVCLWEGQVGQLRSTTSQRLRELLWRDLEQGCTWAHLSSEVGQHLHVQGPSDEQHWQHGRNRVLELINLLGTPLRNEAMALQAGHTVHEPSFAEMLAPIFQGVLRTYRHFLARDLAPEPPRVSAMTLDGPGNERHLSNAGMSTHYGQLTVLVEQLRGVQPPRWMTDAVPHAEFVTSAFPQWSPLLEARPVAQAARAAHSRHMAHIVQAKVTIDMWADAIFGSRPMTELDRELSTSAYTEATGAFESLCVTEQSRALAADERESAMVKYAAHSWSCAQRALAREQAAWENPNSSDGACFWEHLDLEDAAPGRRRTLLVPNLAGSDHADATAIQQQVRAIRCTGRDM